jgi:sec-independent protein translocase protein TatB
MTVAITMPGTGELIFLALLALLIFGPERLPEMARKVGQTIAAVRREANSTMDELKRAADVEGFSEVAGELRGTAADLKRSAALTGPLASAAGAAGVAGDDEPTVQALPDGPAPFDPDAT